MDSDSSSGPGTSHSQMSQLFDWTFLKNRTTQDLDTYFPIDSSSYCIVGNASSTGSRPGSGSTGSNPMQSLNLSTPSQSSSEDMIADLERSDDMAHPEPGEELLAYNTQVFAEMQGYYQLHESGQLSGSTANSMYIYRTPFLGQSMDLSYGDDSHMIGQNDTEPYHRGNEPWNHTELRQQNYMPGYVAYLPQPPELLDDVHSGTHVTYEYDIPPIPLLQQPITSNYYNPTTASFEQAPSSWTWIDWSGSNHQDTQSPGNRHRICLQRGNGRTGPLHPDRRREIREIREMKACLLCWVRKVKCSKGVVCDGCRKRQICSSPLSDRLCCRSGFVDYAELFYPDILISHLTPQSVEDLLNENSKGFLDRRFNIGVSTGRAFTPMNLEVNVFQPIGEYLRFQEHLPTDEEQSYSLVRQYCAPVGLLAIDNDELKASCRKYIESMLLCADYAEEVTAGEKSPLRREILKVVFKYSQHTHGSVQRAMILNATHYSMTKLVTFTPESAARLSRSAATRYTHQNARYISSKLLNRQVKVAIHQLLKEGQKSVLEDFQKELRTRCRSAWPTTFCVILILCLCAEDIQIAADNFVTHKEEGENCDRGDSHKICLALETLPYGLCTQLFHDVFGTFKVPNGHRGDGPFNPFKQGQLSVTELDRPAQELVSGILAIFNNHYDEMFRSIGRPTFDDKNFHTDNKCFVERNPGRLASKFLVSFLGTDATKH